MSVERNIMNKYKAIFILMMFCSSIFALDLEKPVLFDRGKTPRTDAQREASYIVYDTLKLNGIDVFQLSSTTNLDSGSIWFSFLTDTSLTAVDVISKQYLGNWPLTTNKQYLLSAEQPTSSPSKPEPTNEGMLTTAQMWLEEGHESSSGCLSKNPLRYGNVNGDELLFVFFDPSVVVFSPKRGKVDINLLFAQDDVMPDAEYQDYSSRGTFKFSSGPAPQYAALSSIADNREGRIGKDWLYPAQRSYGKIYIDDFNNDQVNDIVMWRKLYFSKLKTDAVNGYELDAEMFAHYAIVDGEYQLQTDTAPETIQGWLTSKNQTWQSGFPSKSECAGQEGQLIPEMHDPLLNDPDVLK
ncbi:MAG: hypothetical protein ACI843_002127 [Psychrobacter glaciei]|jgi:hypothetical protein